MSAVALLHHNKGPRYIMLYYQLHQYNGANPTCFKAHPFLDCLHISGCRVRIVVLSVPWTVSLLAQSCWRFHLNVRGGGWPLLGTVIVLALGAGCPAVLHASPSIL